MISVIDNDPGTKIEPIEAKSTVVLRNSKNEDNFADEGEVSSLAVKDERSEEDRARVSLETVIESSDEKMESRVVEVKRSGIASTDGSGAQNVFASRNGSFMAGVADQRGDSVVKFDRHEELYKTLLSEFDDFVANEKMHVGTSRALSYGFEVGDMVWGKVKSHPWWPGHIFNESFASNPVRHSRREGHVLVAFFGDSSYGWFDPAELIPFDPHFAEKSLQTNSRTFVKAVEEAMDEACRRRGLGLTCKCRNPYNFRSTNVEGYFAVDVPDFEPGGIYSENQITKARDKFKPAEALSFVKQLALAPQSSEQRSLNFVQNKATVLAFRKAVFEEFDETYAQAFGAQPSRSAHEQARAPDLPAKQPPKGFFPFLFFSPDTFRCLLPFHIILTP